MRMTVLPTCMSVHRVHVCYPMESEEGIGSLRTGVTTVVRHHREIESGSSERSQCHLSSPLFHIFLPSIIFVTCFPLFYNNQYLTITITNMFFSLFKIYLSLFYLHWCFACTYIWVRVLGPLKLELQTSVNCHMSVGT